RDVPVWFNARTKNLSLLERRGTGLSIDHDGAQVRVRARRGVVLAGGGFPASATMRERFLPKPVAQYTAAFEGCTGDTFDLAQRAGAVLGEPGEDNALWFPCSISKRRDGSTAVYPHIVLDRAKPGLIAVNAAGKRFVDEAASYHEFTRAMYRSNRSVPSIPAMLICDRRFLWKYGLGMVRPRTLRLKPFTTSGYLHVGESLEELATGIAVSPGGLRETVARHNEFARTGADTDFGKGANSYDCGNGDPKHLPNPCIGTIERPPYYAVAVVPAPLGTSLGLRTDAHARVLGQTGCAIEGLYACGNDMDSVMGGEYPGAGAQLGVAMTFGYVAALHAASAERAEGR
ncbi:MAG: FAD-binding protein, partial [Terriglobia bacterium]